jgi:hypothetical protein
MRLTGKLPLAATPFSGLKAALYTLQIMKFGE